MEIRNGNVGVTVVSRVVAFGMAFVTTAFIATSTLVIFTGSTHAVGAEIARAAALPLRAFLGG